MKPSPEWSQRLLRKGVLVKETYEVFAAWDDSLYRKPKPEGVAFRKVRYGRLGTGGGMPRCTGGCVIST